jgi:hypothetical protein
MSNYHATSINFKTNCFPQFLKNAFPTEGLDDAAAGGFVGRPVAGWDPSSASRRSGESMAEGNDPSSVCSKLPTT